MVRRSIWIAALVLMTMALASCFPAEEGTTLPAADNSGARVTLAQVSPLQPYSPLPTPTPPFVLVTPTPTAAPAATPTYVPILPLAEPPFIPLLEAATPESFQVIVREGDQVWLVTDDGERDLLIDTVTRMGLYLGPSGALETDMPAIEWGGASRDGGRLVLAVGNYPNRQPAEADPPFEVHLYVLDVSSGTLRYLTHGEDPVISPDGSRAVFRRPDERWYLVDVVEGAVPRALLGPADNCYVRDPSWSPSGDRLAVTEHCRGKAHIGLLHPDTGELHPLHAVDYRDMDVQLQPDIYLAWSPDGTYLAYLALGSEASDGSRQQSLWKLPLSGGPPEQLTAGLPVLWFSISPDGQWIALAARGECGTERTALDLWLTDSAGENLFRLTRDEAYDWPLTWAPDGTQLLFSRSHQGLWAFDLADGLMRQLLRGSPGSRDTMFGVSAAEEWQEPWHTPRWQAYHGMPFSLLVERDEELWLVGVGERWERRLLALPQQYYWTLEEMALSPDGTRLAYSVRNRFGPTLSSGQVGVLDLDAGADSRPEEVSQSGWVTDLSWWDSTHLAYLTSDASGPVFVVLDLETGERTEERTDVLRYRSSDGRYLLTRTGLRLEPRLYLLEDTSTGEQFLAIGPEEEARFMGWSPDGSMLFVLSRPGMEGSVVAVVDPADGVRRELTSGAEPITGAAWSPDGGTIAYALCRPAGGECLPELHLVHLERSDDRALPMEEYLSQEQGFPPSRIYQMADLRWSPDGDYIVFRCRHGFRVAEDVWAVRPDGSGLMPLTQGERPLVVP